MCLLLLVFAIGATVSVAQTNLTKHTIAFSNDDPFLVEYFQAVDGALEAQNVRGAAYAFRGPGMAAPVMKGFGLTAASDTSDPVDTETTFMLASISKTYTGAAVAVLVDQGLIDLDDDICDVFGGMITSNCRNPYFPDVAVTWRMMVTHRSSISRDVPWLRDGREPAYAPRNQITGAVGNPSCPLDDTQRFYEDLFVDQETETIVGNQGKLSINWYQLAEERYGGVWNQTYAPGEQNSYSNIAVGYLASLVERVTGEAFPEFCKKHIFDKASMNHTAWFREDLPPGTVEAMPQITNRAGKFFDVGHYCFADYANGQLFSSVYDMAQYAEILLDYGVGTFWSDTTAHNHVFGCQEKDELGLILAEEDCEFSLAWGYYSNESRPHSGPWSKVDHANGIAHEGAETGVSTFMVVLPEAKSYVIILTNSDDCDVYELTDIIMKYGMQLVKKATLSKDYNSGFASIAGDGEWDWLEFWN